MNLKLRTPFTVRRPYKVSSPTVPADCFLVYYDGSLTSVVALRTACMNATPATHVIAVYLEMVPLFQDPAPEGETEPGRAVPILAAATVNGATYGVAVETMALECHARGPALVQLAEEMANAKIYLGTDTAEADPFADYVRALVPSRVTLVSL